MKNDPFIDGVPIKMVIFHGHVKQPKGIIFQKTGVFPKVDDLSKILMRFPDFRPGHVEYHEELRGGSRSVPGVCQGPASTGRHPCL